MKKEKTGLIKSNEANMSRSICLLSDFEQVLSYVPAIIISINKNKELIFWSEKCEQITGYFNKDFVNPNYILTKLFPNKIYKEKVLKTLVERAAGIEGFETRLTCETGDKAIISWSSFKCNKLSDTEQYWFVGENISESFFTWKALQKSEHQLKIAQNIADIGNWEWDLRTGDIKWSDVMYRLFGYDEIPECADVREIFINSIHKEDNELVENKIRELLKKTKGLSFEFRIVLPSGKLRIVNLQAQVLVNVHGKVVRIYGTCQDITVLKEVEIELKKNKSSLEKTQKIAGLGSWQYDFTDSRLFVSDGFYKIFETNQEEFKSIKHSVLKNITDSERKKFITFYENALNFGKQEIIEFSIKNSKGTLNVIEASCTKETDENGYRIHGIFRDITRQREHEKTLDEARKKAEESDRLKSAFLANMSHEIRTPMNAIIGFSSLLSDQDITEEERNEYIGYITSSGESLMTLINDIIDLSKIESEQITIEKKEFSVSTLLKEVVATATEQQIFYSKPNISVINEFLEHENLYLYSDRVRVKQIFDNIVNNAIKFTDTGSVKFGATLKGKKIEFYIKDTGIGIKDENKNKIFSRFVKLENEHNDKLYRGTGLGLSICSRLIELLNGEIRVESVYGAGTTFFFSIPDFENFDMQNVPDEARQISNSKNDWSNKTVLIAEDDELNFNFLEAALEYTQINIIHAWNGQQAVEVFTDSKPDIILMDIQMPVMTGWQATEIIKKIDPKIPVIAQTAFAMTNDQNKIMQKGFNGYLSKPVDRTKLVNLMKKFI